MSDVFADCKRFLERLASTTDVQVISDLEGEVDSYGKELPPSGLEVELAVLDVLRRIERALGQAVRRGQKAGTIHAVGGDRRNRVSVNRYLASGTTRIEVYAMTDDVSDEQFEDALTRARREGDLRRANVLRKLRGEPTPPGRRQRTVDGVPRRQRKPITAAMREVAVDAMKAARTAERLIKDDRFDPSKVDSITQETVRRAAQLLSEAADRMIEGEK